MHDSVPSVFDRAEDLVGMGLDVPKIPRVFISLREKGYPVSPNVYTVEQGKNELMKLLEKGGDAND